MRFGYFIIGLDIVWILVWFSFSIWFEVDTLLNNGYRNTVRDFLFHYASTVGIGYLLRFCPQNGEAVPWGASIAFLFAILSDIQNLVGVIVNLTRVDLHAWSATVVLACVALFSSLLGLGWFFYLKTIKRLTRK